MKYSKPSCVGFVLKKPANIKKLMKLDGKYIGTVKKMPKLSMKKQRIKESFFLIFFF